MTFIATIDPADAPADVRAMYDRQEAAFGYLPNYARVFCYRPELMALWAALQKGIRCHLDARRYELVTLAAARALRSSYCALAHGRVLSQMLPEEEVLAVAAGEPSCLSGAEAAMMDFAARVAGDASQIGADDIAALKAHGFSDAEVFDIAIAAAARAFFTKVVDGLGAAPDAAFLDMPEPLREALTVGRPIEVQDS